MGDQNSLLGGLWAQKKNFQKKNFLRISQWESARARARVGPISGTVTPIELKFSGIIKTPKISLKRKN